MSDRLSAGSVVSNTGRRLCLAVVAALLIWLAAGSPRAEAAPLPYLKISVSKIKVPVGGGTEVKIKLANSSGTPIQGGLVDIEYAFPGKYWTTLEEVETNARGGYSNVYAVPATVDLRARYLGGHGFSAAKTTKVRVTTYTGIPAEGSEYWNPKDGCMYEVEHRAWVGKICSRQLVDSSGVRIEDLFDLYEYDAASSTHVGKFLLEENTREPGWFEFRIPGDSLFDVVEWAALKESEPTAAPSFEVILDGKHTWISEAELKADLQAQQAAAAGQQAAPPSTSTVSVGGESTPQAFTDLLNGFDALGGSEELEQAFSGVYSLNLMDPVDTWVTCGDDCY